ncbi:ATP-dependent protease La [Gloeophyllum trabeum ATCC 11539]|uniref:Lon protease homolog n=1 Tax=Gloeophyllum trabeum (strain ATCC 11539 / FP-39264 / Madison 617) TaxID=670483 RepID=S7Q8I1_GLOTA|nr:ATP-dependent protease La [Gloeophyllum trabeum ATCC 11539]EPQ55832.1 ATP-dependent protease La [Gloeophyllum trabeum ATCC 11539]
MPATALAVLPIPHPLILLPSARLTLPVSKVSGEVLAALVAESDVQPVLAVVPITNHTSNANGQHKAEPVLSEWGTAARIIRLIRPPNRNPQHPYLLSLQGLTRVRLAAPVKLKSNAPTDIIKLHPVEYPVVDDTPSPETVEAFKAAALRLLDRLAKDSTQQSRKDAWMKIAGMVEEISEQRAPWMADVMISAVNGEYNDKLTFLSAAAPEERLRIATQIFIKQASISEVSKKIASAVDESLSKQQKEFFLRQQLAAIHRELQNLNRSHSPNGEASPGSSSELDDDEQHEVEDMADLKKKIEAMEPGSEERKMGVREWRRLKRIPQGSVENGVIRTYVRPSHPLEWLTSIPWPSSAAVSDSASLDALKDRSFLKKAREQLDADHYGLDKIKRRLIEYLAVVRLKQLAASAEQDAQMTLEFERQVQSESKELVKVEKASVPNPQPPRRTPAKKAVKGPILLFVGPPGVGKTSLGQSIARALNRPFQRISLGGVRDEAEIRGHRRTYVASGPGMIVQALRKAGRPDPVLLLDEVDKVGQSNFHGDPSAALLEVLDPEQNHSFNDHYINVPIDLSQVLFICTSNTLDTISPPLLDRCEVIQLSGYTYDEKLHIARRFLLPKQLQSNGLSPSQLTITDPALLHIVTNYTREAGVRSLERAVGSVVRFKAVEWAEAVDDGREQDYKSVVEENELEAILGISRWEGDEKDREERRGLIYGLVVTGQGEGGILPVETIAIPGSGRLKLTGSLGEVIKESGEIALSWVKTHAYDLCITENRAQDPLKFPDPVDIHLHLPAGAQKKDGPSAGVAMACAFVSLLTGACVPTNVAMTGEITLRGRVTPVGGIKEKVLGAHRAQMKKVILPWANRKDVEHDVTQDVRSQMEFVFVKTVEEALIAAFGKGTLGWRRQTLMMESRL